MNETEIAKVRALEHVPMPEFSYGHRLVLKLAARVILKFSTLGNRGIQARGAGQNLSGHVLLTRDEARTVAEKSNAADCLEQAA